ncbi:chemotaxis protein CheW [Novacetimonas maltaceti]|uniref:CheW-like domain-containing protein n=1 Tax=Novacetimonas maltaceti TaxID=1203393 RepID=A0A2S3VZQ4_9PROT|nr:chemotaxis protein CheW [Novacetimonas maltaceti]POF62124.1 hypothetical protein KMAL_22250 [Novacetimonas maltaceti]
METDSSVPGNHNMEEGGPPGHGAPAHGQAMRAMVVFGIGSRVYALPVGDVHECIPAPALSPLPVELPHLPGWFWLGGVRVPVIDLAVLMGLRAPVALQASDLLYRPLLLCPVAGMGGGMGPAGAQAATPWVALLVDRVVDVMQVRADAIMPVGIDRGAGDCIVGEIERGGEPPAIVMEMDGVLRHSERHRLAGLMAREEERAALWATDGARDV